MSDVKDALQKLDAANENHWTQDGSPRLETVKFNNGGIAVTREEIEAGFPGFNKSTAAGYWLTYTEPASAAPQGAAPTAPAQGSGEGAVSAVTAPLGTGATETPSVNGEGATPPEAKAPEGVGGIAGGETELAEVVAGLDDDGAGPNEIEVLEKTFQEIQEHLTGLRGDVDNLNLEIDRVVGIEAKVYNAIQKLRRNRGDHKPSNDIQAYLAAQKERAADRGNARRLLVESGVSLKELAKLTGKSPLDQSMARPTARRGRGSSGM